MANSPTLETRQMDAWRATTFLSAGVPVLSLVWNWILRVMVVQEKDPRVSDGAARPPNIDAVAPAEGTLARPSFAVGADDGPGIGDRSAPVEMMMFLDFQCPFTGQFFDEAFEEKD
jgi:hypothetical protein